MDYFDNIWRGCFTLGMMASHAFAAVLYLSILLLTLYTIAQTGMWLIG